MMDIPDHTLRTLQDGQTTYHMVLDGDQHPLHDVRILVTTTPVRGSAMRGNVYAENRTSYRMEASADSSIYSVLSGTMLGPNSKFGGLYICAQTGPEQITLEGSIMSMSRTSGVMRLSMALVDIR